MSFGTKFAIGMLLLVSGIVGFHRYLLQGDIGSAYYYVAVLIGGAVVISGALNRKFGP